MSFTTWLSDRLRPTSHTRAPAARPLTKRRPRQTYRPCLEGMEERCVPSTIRVNHDFNLHAAADAVNQHGTLDWAAANAKSGDTILLTADVLKTGITLTHGELVLTQQNLTITTEAGAPPVTISGNNASRVFEVAAGASATLSNVYVTGGNGYARNPAGNPYDDGYGGGILVDAGAALTISASTLTGNITNFEGGGILNRGTLTVANNSIVSGNYGVAPGGGIGNESGTLTVSNSTVSDNFGFGVDIYNFVGTATIISSNTANIAGELGTLTVKSHSTVSGTIYSPGSELEVSDSTVSGRIQARLATISGSAISGGILVDDPNGALTIDNHSTVWGGIGVYSSSLTLNDSTVSGGISCGNSYYEVTYTVSGSSITGGIYLSSPGTLSVSLSNVSGGIYVSFGTLSVSGSTVSGGIYNTYSAGTITISADSTVDFIVGPYTIV
jgi:hypothetical protein